MRLLFLYLSLAFTFQHLQAQSIISYFDNMIKSISSIDALEYELHAKELIDGKIFYTHSRVKLQKEPFCFYNYILKPDMGVEILFTHKNKYALINPNGFPFINLKLDPSGKLIRRNQHHTLFDAGFDSFKNIVLSVLELLKASPDRYIIDLGIKQINNTECQVLKVVNPDFSFSEYIVQKGENVELIAKKFNLSSYLILQENNLSFYNDIELGDKILIPNSYGEQFEIWINLQTSLPIVQKVFVNNKLFEYYEFEKIVINPEFSYDEFDKNYVEYNF
jgi:LysM repeat protein